ncbi:endonuclease 8-like 2 [Carcharodon carcharias]|uniref:endonuclease 8-like 2 n=1 Tax=Carcharodon carcharias TaxID=13397 RepID=UPI001B7ED267|nr:endonuclease 8-like 2 [Carcharodon carcharias]
MPEGPSVRRFYSLACLFVGEVVQRATGRTRQVRPEQLVGLKLRQCQVHGKKLYLGFTSGCRLESKGAEMVIAQSQERPDLALGPVLDIPSRQQVMDSALGEVEVEVGSSALSGQSPLTLQREGQWLQFHFGMFGSVRANGFSRAKRANKRGDWQDPPPRLVLYFPGGQFLVFYNCRICPCGSPPSGHTSDILCPEFDRNLALQALQLAQPICYTLLNQHLFSGLGNIIKNEVLYLSAIHPMSLGCLLDIEKLQTLLDQVIQFSHEWLDNKTKGKGLKYHIYQRERCPEGHGVERAELGPPHGLQRATWWCPVCQPAVQ